VKGLLFTYALTYGGALVSLFNPYVGLLIYVCFAIMKPEALWHWSVPAGNYSRIIAIALLVGWSLNGFGNRAFGRSRAVVISLLGFMFWYVISAALATDRAVAFADAEAKAKVVLPFVVGMTLINSWEQLRQLAWVIVLGQGYVAYEANMSYVFGGFNMIRDVHFGGMDNNCSAIAMVCGTGFAFFLGMGERIWWRRGIAFFAAALMAHAVMLSNSRGGLLALLITGAATFVLIRKTPRDYVFLFVAIAIALRMAGPSVVERFSTAFAEGEERDSSAQSRLDLWADCIEIMLRYPVFGIGPNHFPIMAPEFGWPEGKLAHSLWLQVGAELGFPGIGFLLMFYLVAIWRLWRMSRTLDQSDPEVADACRMVVAALVGFMVAAQFVSLSGLELPYYVMLVGAGYLKLTTPAFEYDNSYSFSSSILESEELCTPVGHHGR
jgi:probable O-glycosylation ligase (exosortase A-associated)